MNNLWNREPALILGALGALLSLGLAFGLTITPQQIGAVMAAASALIAVITRQTVTSPQTLQNLTPATLAAAQDATQPVKDTVRKLPAILAAVALAGSLSGCALIHGITNQPTKAASVLVALSDFQWGVSQAHDQLWLSDAEYTLVEYAVNNATDAVNAVPNGPIAVARQIAKGVLLQVSEQLPTNSRLLPYFYVVIALL